MGSCSHLSRPYHPPPPQDFIAGRSPSLPTLRTPHTLPVAKMVQSSPLTRPTNNQPLNLQYQQTSPRVLFNGQPSPRLVSYQVPGQVPVAEPPLGIINPALFERMGSRGPNRLSSMRQDKNKSQPGMPFNIHLVGLKNLADIPHRPLSMQLPSPHVSEYEDVFLQRPQSMHLPQGHYYSPRYGPSPAQFFISYCIRSGSGSHDGSPIPSTESTLNFGGQAPTLIPNTTSASASFT